MATRTSTPEPLRVLELFSGVGGMHCAIRQTGYPVSSVTAIDINPSANRLYSHNFNTTKLLQLNILGISSSFLKQLQTQLWVMSPPCQPFTRQGKKLDLKDERTSAFTHILKLIRELSCEPNYLPTYILLENVQGFECSEARNELVTTLSETGYTYRELLLTPLQFGVPNSRLRYYLIAKLQPLKFKFDSSCVIREWPIQEITPVTAIFTEYTGIRDIDVDPGEAGSTTISEDKSASPLSCIPLDRFLTHLSPEEKASYLLTAPTLQKYGKVLDIVYTHSVCSCCFTRAYGNYLQGTGSVIQSGLNSKQATDSAYNLYFQAVEQGLPNLEAPLMPLELRFFTPKEIANVMCFPADFSFPSDLSNKQIYKLLGNSVNVLVITNLLSHLLLDQ
ncbi:tRNA (cytosine(38)-C(5))-methyltransferase-like [Oopsacas minuta]|uniref:tRNA (cytosine(38)-C(5))-methyltransferase n=1 Tax=Oopsacas minuta TaxID=111878 RepID=A0AAV7JCE1_9METZ|nr:tRNA (cytosine(38)-C(5))-methyltransferase-like [Oopsacas minuta]